MQKQKQEKVNVNLQPLVLMTAKIEIKGVTPLLMHKFSEKSKQEIIDKQTKQTKQKKARNIKQEIEEAIHKLPNGKVGFPCAAFKKAMVEVAPYLEKLDKKLVRGSVQIIGTKGSHLVELKYKTKTINEATVKLESGVADIRYRPQFNDWSCVLEIKYNASMISLQQIANLINLAGFHIGVGDWRPYSPKGSGSFGMFVAKKNK
jgi:hypothetical protein